MSKLKTLAGETVLYGLGNILPRTISFFLIIPYTETFRPAEFGVFTLIAAVLTFVNVIFTFGMETSFFRFATKPGADPQKVFNQVQTIVLAISLPLALSFIVWSDKIANALHIGGHPQFIIWVSLGAFIDAAVAIPFAQLRLRKHPLKYALAKFINIGAVVILTFYFLRINYNPAIGIGYIFIATLLANSLYLLFFASEFFTWRPSFNKELSLALFNYGWPVMVGGLAWAINEMFSRIMLEEWLPKDFYGPDSREKALGIFGACFRFVTLMNLAVQAFRFAAEPFFFSNAADKNSPELFARVNHFFVIVCCVILLSVCINLDILKFLLRSEEYWNGLPIVPVLMTAALFLGIYYNFSAWYKITDRTYYGTIIFSGGAVLTIVLNYFLIPYAGYMGSSWATFIVYLVMAVSCYCIGQRFYPIPYKILSDAGYILTTLLIIFIVSQIEIHNVWVAGAFHEVIILVYLLGVWIIELRVKAKGESQRVQPET
jgi:O-antigen/teichoic acid export membrane protein